MADPKDILEMILVESKGIRLWRIRACFLTHAVNIIFIAWVLSGRGVWWQAVIASSISYISLIILMFDGTIPGENKRT